MTRSHKANDPVHNSEAQGQGAPDTLPRNFGKHASHTEPPNRAKKNGGGKANWGREGDELIDSREFTMHHARRRSNSKGHIEDMFTSKFEVHEEEPEPVFGVEVERIDSASSSSEATDKS